MPRLPKEQVNERESFMRSLFKQNPDLSMPKANETFASKYGSKMRPQRVYALRNDVRKELAEGKAKPNGEQIVLEMNPNAQRLQPLTKAALLHVPTGSEKAFADFYSALVKEGVARGSVTHSGAGFLVVEA